MTSKNSINHKFIGNWNLISMFSQAEDKSKIFPNSNQVNGLLIYTNDGIISAQLGNANRIKFKNQDFRKGNDFEINQAFNGYISYFGNYSINHEKEYIVHDIKMSLFPNWINTKVKRYYEFDEDILTLKATPILYDNVLRTPTLIWQKIRSK